jgi:predicted  nucleic acid-binding Zn-ribbon protein
MAARSPTERINDLDKVTTTILARLDSVEKRLEALERAQSEITKALADLNSSFIRDIALLQREVDDFKKWKDEVKKEREERGRKLWMLLPPLLAAALSSIANALITYYLRK